MPKIENQIKYYHHITSVGLAASISLLLLTLNLLIPINFKSETAVAAGDSTSTTSLTLDVASSTAGVELLVTSDSGTFASTASGEEMSFNVTTNNVTGYMLSIAAKSGTDLTNSTAGTSFTSLDATNSTIAAGITADTFGNASNTIYNNMWGFKPNYYKSNANTDKFYPSPTTSGVTLNKTDSANTNADTYTIAIGARATYAQVAGTYSNTYILSAVGNYPKYSITYVDNLGANDTLPSPNPQAANSVNAGSVNLSSTIPVRARYEFQGWCTANNSTDPTACSNTTYQPGAAYPVSTLSANSVTLYAVWRLNEYFVVDFDTGIDSVIIKSGSPEGATVATVTTSGTDIYSDITAGNNYYILPLYSKGYTLNAITKTGTAGTLSEGAYGYYYFTPAVAENEITITATTLSTTSSIAMQNLSASSCPAYPTPVKDSRDDTVYYVQTLADGRCWMLENLALDLTNSTVLDSVSESNTNADAGSITALKSGNRAAGSQYATAPFAVWNSSNAANTYSVAKANAEYKTTPASVAYGPGRGYVGVYYNYCAASAGSYCYGTNGSTGVSSGDAKYDICPAGWRLPRTSDVHNYPGGLYYLYNTVYSADYNNFMKALSLLMSGYYDNGASSSRGSSGQFWTSTRYNNSSMYRIEVMVSSHTVAPGYQYGSYHGTTLRCVLQGPEYMQNVTSASLAAILPNDGDAMTLYDVRDNNDYTVKSINGQYWMTQNLRFVGTKLDPSSTNIKTATTMTYYDLDSSVADSTYSGHCNGGYGYTHACIHDSGSDETGVWYNYAAATAGTVATVENSNPAEYSICPAGWRLPSGPAMTEGTDFNRLAGDFSDEYWIEPTPGLIAFDAVAGGFYADGAVAHPLVAQWWATTVYDSHSRYLLYWNGSMGKFAFDVRDGRYRGSFVRCVHD